MTMLRKRKQKLAKSKNPTPPPQGYYTERLLRDFLRYLTAKIDKTKQIENQGAIVAKSKSSQRKEELLLALSKAHKVNEKLKLALAKTKVNPSEK